jgi:transcription elongation factor Elf1
MEEISFILSTAGTYEEVDVRCPLCGGKEVLVNLDKNGYYYVLSCKKCGYHKPETTIVA